MRRIQFVLLLVGIGLFVTVVRRVGLDSILDGLSTVGWAFLGVFAIELLIDVIHSEGWRWCLPAPRGRIRRFPLLAARTAGFAVNALTPTATVGGEVVKGMLIRRWVPLIDGFASVLVDKLTFAVGQAVFLVAGLVTVLQAFPFGARERTIAVVSVALWLAGVTAFFFLQRAGIFRVGLGVMRAVVGGSGLIEKLPGRAAEFDAKVATLLGHRRELLASIVFHVLAQIARVPQFWIVLTALGFEPSFGECFATAGGLVLIEATLFLVPAKLGVLEGGQVVIFSALGFGAAAGLTVSFVMRLSELASALLGLVALGWFHVRAPMPRRPPEEAPAASVRPARAVNESNRER